MTKEEAIAQLKMDRDLCNFNPMTGEEEPMNKDCRKSVEALDMAINALEQEPCEDAVSRKAVVEYIKASDAELGHDCEKEIVVGDILTMPSVKPVACIATVKFSKEDLRDICNEYIKIGCTHGTCKDCFYYNIGFDSAEEINKTAEGDERA